MLHNKTANAAETISPFARPGLIPKRSDTIGQRIPIQDCAHKEFLTMLVGVLVFTYSYELFINHEFLQRLPLSVSPQNLAVGGGAGKQQEH